MYVMYHNSEDMSETSHMLDHLELELQSDLFYIEQLMTIQDNSVKILKNKAILLILSIMEQACPREDTWEWDDVIRECHPSYSYPSQ